MIQKTLNEYEVPICSTWNKSEIPWYHNIAEPDDPPEYVSYFGDMTEAELDSLLYAEYGERLASAMIEKTNIAALILHKFSSQWARLVADFIAEYDPITNYDMTEIENNMLSYVGDRTDTESYDNYHMTFTPNHQETTSRTPYDSTDMSDTDRVKIEGIQSGETVLGDDTTFTGTKSNSVRDVYGDDRDRTLTRKGNIGVQTATDMISRDVAFWESHNFFDTILADIASMVTIPIYE